MPLRRLIRERRLDVLAALFDLPYWSVAMLLTGPADRLLSIEGRESLAYGADAPEAEWRAWEAVTASRRGARP